MVSHGSHSPFLSFSGAGGLLIVGSRHVCSHPMVFPTETDDELIMIMTRVYTRVILMEGQVDEEVKFQRAQEAMDLAESFGPCRHVPHMWASAPRDVDGIEETGDGGELIGLPWGSVSPDAVHLSQRGVRAIF